MRDVRYRGRCKETNEWLVGVPIHTHIGTFIAFEENPHYCSQYGYMEIDGIGLIDEETLGEYTGLRDSKRTKEFPDGQEIYDGDIVKEKVTVHGDIRLGQVKFGAFETRNRTEYGVYIEWKRTKEPGLRKDILYWINKAEVIGNVYENPELIKESE